MKIISNLRDLVISVPQMTITNALHFIVILLLRSDKYNFHYPIYTFGYIIVSEDMFQELILRHELE